MLWRHCIAEKPWVLEWIRIPSDARGRGNLWIRKGKVADLKISEYVLWTSCRGPVHTTPEKFQNGDFTLKTRHQMFSVHKRRRNLKTQQSSVILDLCLRKTRSGKSQDYRNYTVFEKLRFQNLFRQHENENSAFSNSSSQKLRFRDGSVWTAVWRGVDNALFHDKMKGLLLYPTCIRMKRALKNTSVVHSTCSIRSSMCVMSANNIKSIAPSMAIHPVRENKWPMQNRIKLNPCHRKNSQSEYRSAVVYLTVLHPSFPSCVARKSQSLRWPLYGMV